MAEVESLEFPGFPEAALEGSVWDRFEAMAALHGARPAVVTDGATWNYKQLLRKASAVAAGLGAADPLSSGPVALLLPMGAKLVAAMLGAVKLGRPYVVIDPSLPEERQKFLLQDAGIRVLIYPERFRLQAESIVSGQVKLLEIATALGCDPATSAPVAPDAAICISYTSGTSGNPSGVVRSHRAVLANIRNLTRLVGLTHEDRLVLCVSPMAGAALLDLFGALLNGACVVPYDVRKSGVPQLVEWLVKQNITFFHAVPTLYRRVVKVLQQGVELPSLRAVLLGGEAVFRKDLESFQRWFPASGRFINVLGMTEGAGILCAYVADRTTVLSGDRVPVGYPVPGKEILIVDPQGARLPPGEVGEIAVESALLASGYHGQQERTSERYQSLEEPGRVRLLTRDLGRIRPEDGALEILGRLDSQIKIRGQRVSLAEVERVLLSAPAVREAVATAVAHSDAVGELDLLAWVVPQTGMSVHPESLRTHLRANLPPEAIPSRFFTLNELPTLPNGKLNRQVLNLSHPAAQPTSEALAMPPRNAVEAVVLAVWSSALGREVPSVYANFFELGGDSLTAINLLNQLSAEFGLTLPGHAMLYLPTVAELAEMIPIWRTQQHGATPGTALAVPALVALSTAGEGTPLYILPGGQGRETEMLVFGQVLRRLHVPRPAFGLRVSALRDVPHPDLSVAEMARRMNALCLHKPATGPWILIGECFTGLLAVAMARQLYMESPALAPAKVVLLDTRTNAHLQETGFQFDPGLISPDLTAYYECLLAWEPPTFDFPLHIITSEEFGSATADPTLGWAQYGVGSITTTRVPGSHSSYLRHYAQQCAEALEAAVR